MTSKYNSLPSDPQIGNSYEVFAELSSKNYSGMSVKLGSIISFF
jgi:hypothetical protein